MELETLTIIAPLLLLSMSHNRKLLWPANVFHFLLVLSCLCFCFATCKPCSTNGIKNSAKHDACGSYGVDHDLGFQDIIIGDASSGNIIQSSATHLNIGSVCANPNLFCFPSTLPGFLSKDHILKGDALEVSRIQSNSPLSEGSTEAKRMASNETWSSDYGMFGLLNDKTVSCSLNFKEYRSELSSIQTDIGNQNDFSSCRGTLPYQRSTNVRLKNHSEMSKPGSLDVSSSPIVEISPPVLDWGKKYLFLPSVAFLTIANTCNDSILHVYEPFSTNTQFYPCNFSEILLGPSEVASICFVFLPRWVGLSKSRLILQTSSGGFLVSAKGFGIESPYKIQPLMNLDVPPSGQLSKNFSLFNPFNEALHVEEVTAWISVSIGNTTYHTEAICSVEKFLNSDEINLLSVKDWLFVKSGQVDFPLMAMRPHRNWEIGSYSAESIMEIDFSLGLEGKISGAVCLQMLRSSHNKSDTVMVPLEVDLDRKAAYDDLTGPISVSLQSLVAHDIGRTAAISLRNKASYMLKLVGITEVADTKLFQIKYMEGLLLLPGTVTQVAAVTCIQRPVDLHDSHPEVSSINRNCKLLVLTNDSCSPQTEIHCQDVISVCSRHQKDLSTGHEYEYGDVESGNTKTGSWVGGMKLPSRIEALETTKADELVLQNWKSQGASGMSVLDDHEVLFPVVEVGNHHAKWITVKNPSQQPVVMQLILNTGEVIDECRGTDGFIQPPSSGSLGHSKSNRPTRYGFSIADSAQTEAYVHPYSRASFGPIFFHPSDRCAWRSSVLIRNNLSGVEWLSLKGVGGSLSLVLFEGSDPVESLEFNLNLLIPHNLTPPDMLFHMEDTAACSQPLSKELYAKNTGDVPLEVRSIEVSGTECRLDGFMVHTCTGFSLEPGESTKLLISYQADFSAAMVHRDLELALASGILVIPMKASLPVFMFNFCRRSVFWMRLKKFSVAVFLAVLLLLLVFSCLYFPLGFQDYHCKSEKNSTKATRSAGKSSRGHRNHRNSKISVPAEVDCLLRSMKEDKISQQSSSGGYPDGANGDPERHMNTEHTKPTLEDCRNTNSFSETQKESALESLPSKAIVVENNNDTVEISQTGNLTIRTGKEKGRRRRKRKGAGAGLTGLLEVSSSQSGNSTPPSPLSPVSSLTPKHACSHSADVDQPIVSRNPFSQMADKHCPKVQVPEPASQVKKSEPQPTVRYCSNNFHFSNPEQNPPVRKVASKHVLSPSATFPSAGKASSRMLCPTSPLASTSTIAPHARAPGPKLCNQKSIRGEQAGFRDEYRYDIWGDHFSGLGVISRSKDVTAVNSSATVNYSDSFFVSGPQALATNTQSRSVSSNQKG